MKLKTLLFILGLSIFLSLCACDKKSTQQTESSNSSSESAESVGASKENPFLSKGKLKYTYRANCQRACYRSIVTSKHIQSALREGKVKTSKKWKERKPCPLYLVSHPIEDGNTLQLAIASCEKFNKIAYVKVKFADSTKAKKCDCEGKKTSKPNTEATKP